MSDPDLIERKIIAVPKPDAALPITQIVHRAGLLQMPFWKGIRHLEAPGIPTARMAVQNGTALNGLFCRSTQAAPVKKVTSHFAMESMKLTAACPVDTQSRWRPCPADIPTRFVAWQVSRGLCKA